MASAVSNIAELALKLRLSQQARERLTQRAAESGRDVDAVASELLEHAVTQPSLDELLATPQAEFASTGMTEEQMMDFGRELLNKVRSAKAPKA